MKKLFLILVLFLMPQAVVQPMFRSTGLRLFNATRQKLIGAAHFSVPLGNTSIPLPPAQKKPICEKMIVVEPRYYIRHATSVIREELGLHGFFGSINGESVLFFNSNLSIEEINSILAAIGNKIAIGTSIKREDVVVFNNLSPIEINGIKNGGWITHPKLSVDWTQEERDCIKKLCQKQDAKTKRELAFYFKHALTACFFVSTVGYIVCIVADYAFGGPVECLVPGLVSGICYYCLLIS